MLEDDFDTNHQLVTCILASLFHHNTNKTDKYLYNIWESTNVLTRFLKLLIQLMPEDHDQIPEGVYMVTPQHQITSLYKSIISRSMDKLNYEQSQQLADELRSDGTLRNQWWIDFIEQVIFDRESSRVFEVNEVKAWLEDNWVASIKTVGQLHSYITDLLKDIEKHLLEDDFSIKLLWRGLQQGKITDRMSDEKKERRQDDRTEEEYVQVWLADELQRRSAGNLVVKREDQNNEADRRDISVSIPSVGSCVIEIKVVNEGRDSVSYNALENTIKNQIVKYIRDEGHRAAILFLFKSDIKKRRIDNHSTASLRELSNALNKQIPKYRENNKLLHRLEGLSVFGIQVEPLKVGGGNPPNL